ncbi:hypothetical protein GCM10009854_32850 [Saccharopolyspora halophila]|uniref:FCD domain-containing protein n=1 Tax=Saccharopolyspora halophila TaxID=405551 RepID=A0ABN3GI76_9PSEU
MHQAADRRGPGLPGRLHRGPGRTRPTRGVLPLTATADAGDIARHARLLEIVETGEPEALLAELATHRVLDGIEDAVDEHTDAALARLDGQRDNRKDDPA